MRVVPAGERDGWGVDSLSTLDCRNVECLECKALRLAVAACRVWASLTAAIIYSLVHTEWNKRSPAFSTEWENDQPCTAKESSSRSREAGEERKTSIGDRLKPGTKMKNGRSTCSCT